MISTFTGPGDPAGHSKHIRGKHAFLMQRGLHEAIDYRTKDWAVEVDRLTNGKGVTLITDPLGGNHWKKGRKATRRCVRRDGSACLLFRYFGGNDVEAVRAVASAAGCARQLFPVNDCILRFKYSHILYRSIVGGDFQLT